MSNRLFSASARLSPRMSQATLIITAALSIAGLSGCSSSSSGGDASKTSTASGEDTSGMNPRDLFYHEVGKNSAAANASGGSSSSSSSGSSTAAGDSAGGAGDKLAVAFCWETRTSDLPGAAILSHSNGFKFKQGDGIRFHFRPSAPCYAYVVLWEGASGSKDQLLYPASESDNGTGNKLDPGKDYAVPANGMLEFDAKPGKEVLGFLLTTKPISPKKAMEAVHGVPSFDPGSLGTNKAVQSGAMSLFATTDATIPASEFQSSGSDRAEPGKDPYVYEDNSKDPSHGIGIGVPFQHI